MDWTDKLTSGRGRCRCALKEHQRLLFLVLIGDLLDIMHTLVDNVFAVDTLQCTLQLVARRILLVLLNPLV